MPNAPEVNVTNVRFVRILAVLAVAALAAWPARAQDQGVKQVEQLVKKSGSTVQAIAETKMQLQKTMDVYNTLMSDDVKNMKGNYKKLQSEMESTEKKRGEIKQRADEMNAEATTLFKSWADSTAAIENADLRKRSEERLDKTKASFAEIGTLGQKASDLYGPFMKTLEDQVTYLGHDLNAQAVESLKGDAAKVNQKAQDLMKSIDETITVANKNINELRPQ
jgi:chromosome segregation ATPase